MKPAAVVVWVGVLGLVMAGLPNPLSLSQYALTLVSIGMAFVALEAFLWALKQRALRRNPPETEEAKYASQMPPKPLEEEEPFSRTPTEMFGMAMAAHRDTMALELAGPDPTPEEFAAWQKYVEHHLKIQHAKSVDVSVLIVELFDAELERNAKARNTNVDYLHLSYLDAKGVAEHTLKMLKNLRDFDNPNAKSEWDNRRARNP
jgi:hypothetical protein